MNASAAPLLAPGRIIVGIAAMEATADPEAQLVTYALGSCLGISVYDPVARVGGLLHCMLPHASLDVGRASERPAMFVDSGVPELFRACYRLGAQRERLELRVAGGAAVGVGPGDFFRIGERNVEALRAMLSRNGVAIRAEDVGGDISRTMSLCLATGEVTIQSRGVRRCL